MALLESDLYFENPYRELTWHELEEQVIELDAQYEDFRERDYDDRYLEVNREHRVMVLHLLGVRVLPVPYYEGEIA